MNKAHKPAKTMKPKCFTVTIGDKYSGNIYIPKKNITMIYEIDNGMLMARITIEANATDIDGKWRPYHVEKVIVIGKTSMKELSEESINFIPVKTGDDWSLECYLVTTYKEAIVFTDMIDIGDCADSYIGEQVPGTDRQHPKYINLFMALNNKLHLFYLDSNEKHELPVGWDALSDDDSDSTSSSSSD